MDIAALLAKALEWGPTAVPTILIFLILYLSKQIKKNAADNDLKNKQLQVFFENQSKDLKEDFKEQLKTFQEDVGKNLEDITRRVSYLEMETVKNDTFYREVSGWRAEINRLSDQIVGLFNTFTGNVIKIWQAKKGDE